MRRFGFYAARQFWVQQSVNGATVGSDCRHNPWPYLGGISELRLKLIFKIYLAVLLAVPAFAQSETETPADDPAVTMFPHSQTSRFWISGQSNIIFQYHPGFDAKYSGPHSFGNHANDATSHVSTLFLGYELTNTTEVFVHFEEASGGGLSDGLGLAGFANLDVVRNPVLSKDPYLARVMLRQIVPLSKETTEEERDPWYLATKVPARRLEFRFGKMGINDFFDGNDV